MLFLLALLPFILIFPKTPPEISLSRSLTCYHREQQGRGNRISRNFSGGQIPAGRCWHNVPRCWHSLGWQVERVLCYWSSTLHATCQSQHHLSCTGHSAQPVCQVLQMKEQCFTEGIGYSCETCSDTSHGCISCWVAPWLSLYHSQLGLLRSHLTLDGGFSICSCQRCSACIQLKRQQK